MIYIRLGNDIHPLSYCITSIVYPLLVSCCTFLYLPGRELNDYLCLFIAIANKLDLPKGVGGDRGSVCAGVPFPLRVRVSGSGLWVSVL